MTIWFLHGSPQLPCCPRRIPGARGETALHVAARNGRAFVVERLISAGATVDAVVKDGRGPGRFFGIVSRDILLEKTESGGIQ